MMNAIAGVFASIGMLFGGMFGGHHGPPPNASSTPPVGNHGQHMGSTTPWGMGSSTPGHMGDMMPGVFGKVLSISGNTLTISGHSAPNTATTTFTVDATNAKVVKGGMGMMGGDMHGMPGMKGMATGTPPAQTTIPLSDIKVNDSVLVTGTVSGTNVVAKMIIDGIMPSMMMGAGHGSRPGGASSTRPASTN